MAKWKEFASIFGLELEEEFKIKQNGEVYEEVYKITSEGIKWKSFSGWGTGDMSDTEDLLTGDAEVIKIPWKPRSGEEYWWYCLGADYAVNSCWVDNSDDFCFWKVGNVFKTKEEAETKGRKIIEAIIKEYEAE